MADDLHELERQIETLSGRECLLARNILTNKYQKIDLDKMEALAKETHRLAFTARQFDIAAESIRLLGVSQHLRSQYLQAITYFEQALHEFELLSDIEGMAKCHNNLGVTFLYTQNFKRSWAHLQQHLTLRERLKEPQGIITAHHSLAGYYYFQQDYDKALATYQTILALQLDQGNNIDIARTYSNIGTIYFQQKQPAKAIDYLHRSIEVDRQNDDQKSLATSYLNIALCYRDMGDMEQALKYSNEALGIYTALGIQRGMAGALINLAGIYLNLSPDSDQAEKYLIDGLKICEEIDAKDYELEAYNGLVTLYEARSDTAQALTYHKKYAALEKELLLARKDKELLDLQIKYETMKTEMKNQQLTDELKIKKEQLNSFALKLAQQHALLANILAQLRELAQKPTTRAGVQQLIAWLHRQIKMTHSWDDFEARFCEVHRDFITRLTREYDLTPRHLQVCVLIRTGLHTKEIANLLYISERSVDTYRHHIRKKLGLSPDQNLTTFLLSL